MNVWAARAGDGSRIRLQFEPFDPVLWPGWELRSGTFSQREHKRLCASTDDVEVERIHQELWRRLKPIEEA